MTEKEIRARKIDPRSMSTGGIAWGPQYELLGLAGLNHRLAKLLMGAGPQNFGEVRPKFFFEHDGLLARKTIVDGLRSVRIYRDGDATIDIGISLATMSLPHEEYRKRLVEFILDGSRAICERAKKKKLEFDAERFMSFMQGILDAFLAIPLPLPATEGELFIAHRFLGVPYEPEPEE